MTERKYNFTQGRVLRQFAPNCIPFFLAQLRPLLSSDNEHCTHTRKTERREKSIISEAGSATNNFLNMCYDGLALDTNACTVQSDCML